MQNASVLLLFALVERLRYGAYRSSASDFTGSCSRSASGRGKLAAISIRIFDSLSSARQRIIVCMDMAAANSSICMTFFSISPDNIMLTLFRQLFSNTSPKSCQFTHNAPVVLRATLSACRISCLKAIKSSVDAMRPLCSFRVASLKRALWFISAMN